MVDITYFFTTSATQAIFLLSYNYIQSPEPSERKKNSKLFLSGLGKPMV